MLTGPFAFCGVALARRDKSASFVSTNSGIWADSNTLFRVASISKIVVGQAIAALVETNATTWGTDISDILGWHVRHPQHPEAPITLGMVTAHHAGLTDDADYIIPSGDNLQTWCEDRKIHAKKPGAHFSYSNLGYIILAELLEKLSGKAFPDAVHPFLPPRSGFNWVGIDPTALRNRIPTYRKMADAFVAQIDLHIDVPAAGAHPGIYSPQGGLRTSLAGLLNMACRIKHANKIRLWTPEMGSGDYIDGVFESYGAGLQIFDNPIFYPGPLIGHFGNAYGFNGGVWYDPEKDLSFAYALNGLAKGDDSDAFSDTEQAIFSAVADV